MVSETNKNSQDQALEERLSNMHEQMAGVTSRLDQTERALDLERATREDIIKAEVERRIREAEERIRKEIEAEYADERAVMDKKAYLFSQTDEACERAAMMYSFFGACKVKGKNPERWLAYVLDHIGSTKDEDLYKLLPEFWEDIN